MVIAKRSIFLMSVIICSLDNFINQLDKNDLLIFFSDTPPMFSVRDRIHFEDFLDLFFFKKK